MQNTKLDEKIDKVIAAFLPSPLARAYLATVRWCNKHMSLLIVTFWVGAIVGLLLSFINHQHTK